VRALLTTRKLLQAKRHDGEMSLRGVLRGFGLKVGPTTPKTFAGRVREGVAQHDTLRTITDALVKARAVLEQEFKAIEKRLSALARTHAPADDDPWRGRDRSADLCRSHRRSGPLSVLTHGGRILV
jgi:transposase